MREEILTFGLRPTIPEGLKIEKLVPNQESLIIFINKGSEIPQTEEMIYSIEAILLTAKEFGYKTVEIKNANIDNIGPFRLDKPIEVPLAANRREI